MEVGREVRFVDLSRSTTRSTTKEAAAVSRTREGAVKSRSGVAPSISCARTRLRCTALEVRNDVESG
jgi:hypothetical protein